MKCGRYTTWLHPAPVFVLIGLLALVYLPGLSGPFVFDDYTNLLDNAYVQVTSLQLSELRRAIFSLQAGPLQRPVSMLTFALNYYWVGGFDATLWFKAVNLVIHVLNGLLIYWFGHLVLTRGVERYSKKKHAPTLLRRETIPLYAGAVALLWIAHPIQLTSVLYIVQRMTELAALFMLVALVCYLKLRIGKKQSRVRRAMLLTGVVVGSILATLSKENALALPALIAVIEFTLFADAWPWRKWPTLAPTQRKLIVAIAAIVFLGLMFFALRMALPGYAIRDFDMLERLMTQARVLFFYLGLIVVPRIDQFGLLHDDIPISRSLLDPWTTLPALIGVAALIVAALMLRRRAPLISLGVLWFFAAHLLESTIFPLEIAHEHRNYLASWGILLALVGIVDQAAASTRQRALLAAIPLLLAACVSITLLRAVQWADANKLYQYEALHHPNSSGAQAGLGSLLNAQGDYPGALLAFRRASELDAREPAFLLGMHLIAANRGQQLDRADHEETLRRLKSYRITATTGLVLDSLNRCISDSCKTLQPNMEQWMKAALSAGPSQGDASYYYYLLGRSLYGQRRINEAVQAFAASHAGDPMYLFPLLELAAIYLESGNLKDVEVLLAKLHEINQRSPHPRTADIQRLEAALADARKPRS